MFKTISLPADTWAKIIRRLTVEVGANDDSRLWAAMLEEQIGGAVKVKVTRGSVSFKAGKGGDLRDFLGIK